MDSLPLQREKELWCMIQACNTHGGVLRCADTHTYQNWRVWSMQFTLMSLAPQLRILFVCLGNICRSPAAEIICRAVLRKTEMAGRVTVDSCGTASYHVGSRPDARMLAALERAGFRYDGHRARQLRKEDGARFELIVPQDSENMRDVHQLLRGTSARVVPMREWFPAGCTLREVPDPYYGGAADFDGVVQLLANSMPQLIKELRAELSARDGNSTV